MENDPLEILVVPHAVIEWQEKQGLLMKRFFPEKLKQEREKGKYAVFHGKIRLNKLFDRFDQAHAYTWEIVGEKKQYWANKRIFTVKQL